jgi:hypothetical protein
MRGGATLLPPDGPPNWPTDDGCTILPKKYIPSLPIDTYLDRIGPTTGRFVAILQKDPATDMAKAASYASRSLRTLGETAYPTTIGGVDVPDLRELLYKMIYKPENDPNNDLYYVLRVAKPGVRALNPCRAKAVFGYPGGAFQLALNRTIEDLIKDKSLEKLTPAKTATLLGRNFPVYRDEHDGNPAAFEPYNPVFNMLLDNSAAAIEARRQWRIRQQLPASPAPYNRTPIGPLLNVPTNYKLTQDPGTPKRNAAPTSSLFSPLPFPSLMSPTPIKKVAVPVSTAILRKPIEQRPPWRG